MKKNSKQKKGISLIVLVITIIVMIILASAIILSLRSSGIIGRANEAKTKSDIANAKEVVGLAYAEWELDNAKLSETYSSFSEYANHKLDEAGFDTESIYVTEEGDVFFDAIVGTINTVAKEVPIGAKIEGYKLTQKNDYITDGKERSGEEAVPQYDEDGNYLYDENSNLDTITTKYTGTAQTLKMSTDVSWKYVGTDENGNVLIAADVTDTLPSISLSYQGGIEYGIPLLDTICNTFYTTDKGTARNMKLEDVKSILKYDGPCGYYVSTGKPYESTTMCSDGVDTGVFNDVFGINSTIEYPSESYFNIKPDDEYIDANEIQKNIIYTQNTYLLSSVSVSYDTMDTQLSYAVYYVDNAELDAKNWTYSYWYFNGWLNYDYPATGKIRPIVTLNSSLQAIYDDSTNTLTLM